MASSAKKLVYSNDDGIIKRKGGQNFQDKLSMRLEIKMRRIKSEKKVKIKERVCKLTLTAQQGARVDRGGR